MLVGWVLRDLLDSHLLTVALRLRAVLDGAVLEVGRPVGLLDALKAGDDGLLHALLLTMQLAPGLS